MRRHFDRAFLDLPDALVRRALGRSHWPPYSLRAFVGGAQGFDQVGHWFLKELARLQLFRRQTRILDIGCGCGRLAYALATNAELTELSVSYAGMDIDEANVDWCREHITPINSRFQFQHADIHNPSYNPQGNVAPESYLFPDPASSFELILLTSVCTHLLKDGLRNYLAEVSRLLAPGGVAYASFFLYHPLADAPAGIDRHGIGFKFRRDHHAVNREDYPTNAVAYAEDFIRTTAANYGLAVIEPIYYGSQDIVLFTKLPKATEQPELLEGWHSLESNSWRWTERVFAVRLAIPAAGSRTLRFRFTLPQAILPQGRPLRLSATANGVSLPTGEYSAPGEHLYVQPLDTPAGQRHLTLRFELDQAYDASPADQRELGLQVAFHTDREPLSRDLQPFLLSL